MRLGSDLEPSWGRLGAVLGPSWGRLGAILAPLGAVLGPPWALLGPPLSHLRHLKMQCGKIAKTQKNIVFSGFRHVEGIQDEAKLGQVAILRLLEASWSHLGGNLAEGGQEDQAKVT